MVVGRRQGANGEGGMGRRADGTAADAGCQWSDGRRRVGGTIERERESRPSEREKRRRKEKRPEAAGTDQQLEAVALGGSPAKGAWRYGEGEPEKKT